MRPWSIARQRTNSRFILGSATKRRLIETVASRHCNIIAQSNCTAACTTSPLTRTTCRTLNRQRRTMEAHEATASDLLQSYRHHQHPLYCEHDDNDDFRDEHKDHNTDESDIESDFFADSESVTDDAYATATYGGNGNNMMTMDLSNLCPVGGLRRVSSCYFSICSNISSEENIPSSSGNDSRVDSPTFGSCDIGMAAQMESREDTAANCIPTAVAEADFLYHDILMNVFSYLDAPSLATFSETAKRPNFECFYFLELQLQRALLRGTTSRSGADVVGEEDGLSFIAGTGVISRLAAMDESKAREIVQTYLDSNSSIHAMPLSHSLAYLRQVFRQHGLPNMKLRIPHRPTVPVVPALDNQMAKNTARNMALLFTFIGAASYMHGAAPEMPDPSDVINSENVAALRDALLKMGLAGGVLKTMKEAAAKSVKAGGEADVNALADSSGGVEAEDVSRSANGAIVSRPRHSSLGSLEDLTQMLPAKIASRLCHAFSGSASVPSTSMTNSNQLAEQKEEVDVDNRREISSPTGGHRSKRSHSTTHVRGAVFEGNAEDHKSSSTSIKTEEADTPATNSTQHEQDVKNALTSDVIAHAMKHPVSSNPYDHITASFNSNHKLDSASSLFSFSAMPPFTEESATTDNAPPPDSGKVPSGCVGAYANAVKNAATHVTRLIKQTRKSNFEALALEEQLQLGVRFIDACSSDDKLSIVKEILQKENCMDVDRFFLGPDDTETCALHAAAFNGAEQVLEFLSGGMDEYDSGMDCGLCDVDIRDANGWTALHFAAGANSVSSVRILAQHGAKLTIEVCFRSNGGLCTFMWELTFLSVDVMFFVVAGKQWLYTLSLGRASFQRRGCTGESRT
eukprot:CCRYP_000336-RB/>CCRYP_000336-RB protein AED:0.38 eAED:0.38 QI:99/1/1/1/1/1/5/527/856